MNISIKKSLSTLLFLAAFSGASALSAPANKLTLPVQLKSSDSVQRLSIPASFIVNSQRADLSDVVIQDSDKKTMQMAWLSAHDTTAQEQHDFPAYPIIGSSQQPASNTNFKITDLNGQRVVEFNDSTKSNDAPQTLGALFDTRALSDKQLAVKIDLDADLPAGQIIDVNLTASNDLSHWENVLESASIAQFKQTDGDIKQVSIELPASDLNGKYLRIMWSDNPNVKIKKATIITKTQVPMTASLQSLNLQVPKITVDQKQNQNLTWQFGHPIAITGLDIQTQNNSLTPLRIFGRSSAEARWQLLDSTVVFQLTQNGQTRHNAALKIDADISELRFETDKSVTLPTDIKVALQVSSRDVAFLTNGKAPFFLTFTDEANQKPLNINTLIPNYKIGDEAKLPLALVSADMANANTVSSITSSESKRPYLLWGILGGGVILLAGMVLLIFKQMKHKAE